MEEVKSEISDQKETPKNSESKDSESDSDPGEVYYKSKFPFLNVSSLFSPHHFNRPLP